MNRRAPSARGFTLLELMIVLTLLAIVSVKIFMVVQTATRSHADATTSVALDDHSRRILDRIAYAIMGCTRETLFPDPESPIHSNEVEYEISLGVDADGNVVWSDPERIGLSDENDQVVWSQNPGAAEERRIVWTNAVRPFLEGEIVNGEDDNGNGLVDERGLCFSLNNNRVTIRLTLERMVDEETTITHTVETVATCRN